jgi:hypothetical protein
MVREFVKISVQDLEIAEAFFENEKHFNEWLINVFNYYLGKNVQIKTKIVQKYFNSYKKTMDYLLQQSNFGKSGALKKTEIQQVKETTLKGGLEDSLKDSLEAKDKYNNKEKEKDKEKEKEIYKFFSHLSISIEEVEKIKELGFTKFQIDEVLESIENYKGNTKYKSLYLTAKKWLNKERIENPPPTEVKRPMVY